MRTLLTIMMVAVIAATNVQAQMELPQPSPTAMVKQTAGLTDITIEYSSPAKKDRIIFGGLVPYDKIWRTGANKATAITFSRDVEIEEEALPAGTYSLFTIPGEEEWTIIFNKETELWGTGSYDEANDALRVTVNADETDEYAERMRFIIEDFDNDEAIVSLLWDKVKVSFEVSLNTSSQAYASIERTLNPSWQTYAQAARFAWEQEGDLNKAAEWAGAAITIQEDWYSYWIMGEVMAEQGDTEAAIENMKMALELGNQADNFWYKSRVEKNIAAWTAK